MSKMDWTPEQQQAIDGQGGSILVSAAAGSGKTAVLVERVVKLLTHPQHPVDANRLLVVTFSNAAAGEMKQRISRKLWELTEENPNDPHLARQQLLLESAQISTIHAFCISLIRSYFQKLRIPPEFRIGEERELDVIRMKVLREVIERQYAKGEPCFFDLVELLSSPRDDHNLEKNILKLYDFIRNHPFYGEWLEEVLGRYDETVPLEKTVWAKIMLDYAADVLDYCRQLTRSTIGLVRSDAELEKAYLNAFLLDAATLDDCQKALDTGNWDACCQVFSMASFGKIGSLSSKYQYPERKEQAKNNRQTVKDLITGLKTGCFLMSQEQYRQDIRQQRPMVETLFAVTREFDEELKAAKLEKNLLDFGDLEHYALELLYEDREGQHRPSAIAREVSKQYDQILVDEYQDTNSTQEMIFSAVSQDGKNLFMVGDVKQSIYRFRQARPEIFLKKKESFAPYDGVSFPAKISLNANFRTRKETTGLINDLFSVLMNPTVGEMYYREEDRLCAAADYDYSHKAPVTLAILDPASLEEKIEGSQLEAEYIAGEIRNLLEAGTTVRDKKGNPRPLEPRDICILLRSPKNRADRYIKALEAYNIHCWVERQSGFLTSREVGPVVAYLKLLSNPLLDLELAQVLLSPMYGLTSEDLAILRAAQGGKSLFLSVGKVAQGGNKTFDRFLEDYHKLRSLSASVSVEELLLRLYTATGLLNKVRAMPQGESRVANLYLLMEYAAGYERGGSGDFADFVSYLYALEEFDYDLQAASTAPGNAVSLMSVHKSKGLEFPVVFLAAAGAKFNLQDLNDEVLLHPELGFACTLRDNRKVCEHETVPRAAMREENRRALLSEELRILYVAMTRAREKLFLVAVDKGLSRLNAAAAKPFDGKALLPWTVRSGRCWYDWLVDALVHHRDFDPSLLEVPQALCPMEGCEGSLEVRHILTFVSGKTEAVEAPSKESPANEATLAELREAVEYRYPYQQDTVTLSKMSVSQLTHDPGAEQYFFVRRPKALTSEGLTPTERGIAAHKFMQFAQLDCAVEHPAQEIQRLRDRGFISKEEAQEMDQGMLKAFFASEIGKRMLGADKIYREIRFLREFTPEELEKISPKFHIGGSTVIQGIADCVIVEDGQGTIVDYKTDRVKTMGELAERYGAQLDLYKAILEDYLGIPIRQKVLYSFALSKEILVP